ncbi:MAG: PAS domain S-box protein, partial [Anaerolineales bacterium]|nr:PAS domain S-box protein [Anaerolineales bacterium]
MKKIMIVDDNEQSLYLLQVILQADGYQVIPASNGAEALQKAENDPPDLVISDILMPVMDGFTLCRNWKQNSLLKEIPLVFYTATYTDPQDKEFALSLGAERFIIKPAESEEITRIAREVIDDAEKNRLKPQVMEEKKEPDYLLEYNTRLIKKLEDKLDQLDKANQELEHTSRELTRQRDHLQLLHNLDQLMRSTLSCTEMADLVTVKLVNSLGIDSASLWLADETGQFNQIGAHSVHPANSNPDLITLAASNPLPDHLSRTGKILIVQDTNKPEIARFIDGELSPLQDIQSFLAAPLTIREEMRGFILLINDNTPHNFTKEEIQLVESISAQVAICIYNSNLFSAVERSERRYRTILQGSADAIITVDPQGKIEEWSIGAERITSYKREHIQGKRLEILVPEHEQQSIDSALEQMHKNGFVENWQTRLMTKDGNLVDVEITLTDMGSEMGYTAIFRDVRKRKQDEEALLKSQQSLSWAQAIAHLGNWDWNILTNELAWSDEVYRIFGLVPGVPAPTYDEFLAKVHPEDREYVNVSVKRVLDNPSEEYKIEHRIIRPDGSERYILENGEVTRDRHGKAIRMIGTVQDITERVQWRIEIRQRATQQEALNTIIAAAASATGLQNLLDIALDQTLHAMRLQMGAIWIYSNVSIRGLPSSMPRNMLQIDAGHQLSVTSSFSIEDWMHITADNGLYTIRSQMLNTGIRASITVPIVANENPIGALSL